MGTLPAAVTALALASVAAYALHLAAIDEPEGDEETAACINAADTAREYNPASSCDDAGPVGFGIMSGIFGLASALVGCFGWRGE